MYCLKRLCFLTKMIIVMHWSIRSFNKFRPSWVKIASPLNIETFFFVWTTNVVESSKVVLLVGFSLVSINLQCENCLSRPFAPESRVFTFKLNSSTKTCVLERLDTSGSNAPPPGHGRWSNARGLPMSGGGGGYWSDRDRRLRYAVDGRYHFPPTDLMYVCFLFLCLAVLFSKVTNVPGFHVIKLRNLVKLVSTTFS